MQTLEAELVQFKDLIILKTKGLLGETSEGRNQKISPTRDTNL